MEFKVTLQEQVRYRGTLQYIKSYICQSEVGPHDVAPDCARDQLTLI